MLEPFLIFEFPETRVLGSRNIRKTGRAFFSKKCPIEAVSISAYQAAPNYGLGNEFREYKCIRRSNNKAQERKMRGHPHGMFKSRDSFAAIVPAAFAVQHHSECTPIQHQLPPAH